MAIIAFEGNLPVGVGTLKTVPIPGYEQLGPWVGAGYVVPTRRRHGIGAVILSALAAKGKELGYKHLYCGTSSSESLLRRSGWSTIAVTSHEGKPLTVFRSAA